MMSSARSAASALIVVTLLRVEGVVHARQEGVANGVGEAIVAVEQNSPIETVWARARAGEGASHVADSRKARRTAAETPDRAVSNCERHGRRRRHQTAAGGGNFGGKTAVRL